jgi:hypothetical protein
MAGREVRIVALVAGIGRNPLRNRASVVPTSRSKRWRSCIRRCHEVGEAIDLLLAAPELGRVYEIRRIRQMVCDKERSKDLLVDLIADVALALECDHVHKTRALRDRDGRIGFPSIPIAYVFHEQKHEDAVLVLRRIHAAT